MDVACLWVACGRPADAAFTLRSRLVQAMRQGEIMDSKRTHLLCSTVHVGLERGGDAARIGASGECLNRLLSSIFVNEYEYESEYFSK